MIQKKMIIFPHTEDCSLVSAVVLDSSQTVKNTFENTSLSQLSSEAEACDIIFLVPAMDVTLVTAQLPKMSHSQLQQALPFALEDQIIGDLSELHFAIFQSDKENISSIAVVENKKMNEWLAIFRQNQLLPNCFLPVLLALPKEEKSWSVAILPDQVLVRTGRTQGFSCEMQNLKILISMALQKSEHKPERIHIFNYTKELLLWSEIEHLPCQEESRVQNRLMTDLAAGALNVSEFNLLQGSYQPKRTWAHWKNTWMLAASLMGVWIIILLCSQLISYFILSSRYHELQSEISTIYYHEFPSAHSLIAVKERMQSKLDQARAHALGDPLFTLLAAAGKGLSENSSVTVERLDYQQSQLTLHVAANSFADLDKLTHLMEQQGISLKQANAATVDAKVKADLIAEVKKT